MSENRNTLVATTVILEKALSESEHIGETGLGKLIGTSGDIVATETGVSAGDYIN